ncbi:hypothetical protein FBQ82_02225 [Anaerolineae bacterium CFX7]|nr:hypothetical protein [Anaerolineae bacterium CFX7]
MSRIIKRHLLEYDIKYDLFGVGGIRDIFPAENLYFTIQFDIGAELRTCIDRQRRIRTGSALFREFYRRHHLKVGDPVYIQIVEPNRVYRFSAKPPTESVSVPVKIREQHTTLQPSEPRPTRRRAIADSQRQQELLLGRISEINQFLEGRTVSRPTDEQLCDWVNFCYSFEMYPEGAELFRLVTRENVNEWYYERTRKLAKICELRAQR